MAQVAQGQLVALTRNRLLICEARLERDHVVTNTAEAPRREQRRAGLEPLAREAGRPVPSLRTCVPRAAQRAAQRSVKLLRWLSGNAPPRKPRGSPRPVRLSLLYVSP